MRSQLVIGAGSTGEALATFYKDRMEMTEKPYGYMSLTIHIC